MSIAGGGRVRFPQLSFTAGCNGLVEGSLTTLYTGQDIDLYISCALQSNGKMEMKWTSALNPSGVAMKNIAVVLDSTGKKYLLEGDCVDSLNSDRTTTDDTLDLGSGFYSDGAQGQGIKRR